MIENTKNYVLFQKIVPTEHDRTVYTLSIEIEKELTEVMKTSIIHAC